MRKLKLLVGLFVLCSFAVNAQLTPLKPLLNSQINNAVIDIPTGKYLMDTQNGGGYSFNNLSNVTINLNGSEIICNKATNVFTFNNCSNVTVKGFSVDFDPLIFTQGVITAVDASKMWFEFVVDEGYPVTNIQTNRTQFFDSATRELKRNSITVYDGSHTITAVSGTINKFRVFKSYSWDATEAVGDMVVLSCAGSGHAFYMNRCQDMNIEDVTLYGAATFAFFENETNNSHYLRCKVTPKRNETYRPSARLRSSNADGIHSKNAKKGPTIEDCQIDYGADDCIAINGAMYPIYAVDAANRTISLLSSASSSYLTVGDTAQLVSYAGKKLGIAKMEITRATSPSASDISFFLSKYNTLQNKEAYTYGIQIRLSQIPDGLTAGDVIYSRDKIGSGYIIKNNKVGHIRSRAILIKASDGLITGNTISDCEMGGIVVSPEYDWMEAGFAENLEISNNTITNCMFGRSSTSGKAGALSIMCVGGNRSIAPVGAFNKISIHNNSINACPRPSVVVTSIDGLQYYSNSISSDLSTIRVHGQTYGVPNNVDFWAKNVTYNYDTSVGSTTDDLIDVVITNSKISGLQKYINGMIYIYRIDGSLIFSKNISSDSLDISQHLNKNALYILSVRTNDMLYNQKILIY